jgi:hypothetical protein
VSLDPNQENFQKNVMTFSFSFLDSMDANSRDTKDYINPSTDTGFKRLFNDKTILISFLNEVLPPSCLIRQVVHVEQVRSEPTSPVSTPVEAIQPERRSQSAERAVENIYYGNTEDVGPSDVVRVIRYDILCVTQDNVTIIVEMQRATETHFMDRLLYYGVRQIIKRQGWPGKKPLREPFAEGLSEELGIEPETSRNVSVYYWLHGRICC